MQGNLLAGRLRKHFPVRMHAWKQSLSSSELTSERLPRTVAPQHGDFKSKLFRSAPPSWAEPRMVTDWSRPWRCESGGCTRASFRHSHGRVAGFPCHGRASLHSCEGKKKHARILPLAMQLMMNAFSVLYVMRKHRNFFFRTHTQDVACLKNKHEESHGERVPKHRGERRGRRKRLSAESFLLLLHVLTCLLPACTIKHCMPPACTKAPACA